jgi:hypothetical protein
MAVTEAIFCSSVFTSKLREEFRVLFCLVIIYLAVL